MFVKKGPAPIVKPDPFPDAIAKDEPAVIDRNHRLRFWHDAAIDVDQDRLISDVFFGLVRSNVIGQIGPLFGGRLVRWMCQLQATLASAPGPGGHAIAQVSPVASFGLGFIVIIIVIVMVRAVVVNVQMPVNGRRIGCLVMTCGAHHSERATFGNKRL